MLLITVLKFADLGVGLADLAGMSGSDAYVMLRSMEDDIASDSVVKPPRQHMLYPQT